MNPKLSVVRKQEIVSLYLEGKTTYQIANELQLDRSTVSNLITRLGLTRPYSESHRRHTFNEWAFDVIDEHAAYWLGFITADGNVHNRTLSLAIHVDDWNHLEKFKAWLEASYPITQKKGRNLCCISVTSEHFVQRLGAFGIVPAKTYHLTGRPPLPQDMIRHYYRGLIDGDGHVGFDKKNAVVMFTAYKKEVVTDMQDWLLQEDPEITPVKLTHRHTWLWRKRGNNQARRVIQLLYHDAQVYLDRKQAVAEVIMGNSP